MAKTIKPVFKDESGEEHETPESAEQANELIKAKDTFREARDRVLHLLKSDALTADGVRLGDSECDFWYVTEVFGSWPEIRKVTIYLYYIEFDSDYHEGAVLRERNRNGRGDGYDTYELKKLYAHESNARKAHVAACEALILEMQSKLEELRTKYAK